MPNFEVHGQFTIKKEGVTVEAISQLLKISLAKYYNEQNIMATPTGITVQGNLKDMWERAITKAEAQVVIEGDQLTYRVNGDSSLGGWPWVWLILGFFTGVFAFLFLFDLIKYMISRYRPKQYFEEAFKSVQFEISAFKESLNSTTFQHDGDELDQIERLAALKEKGIITNDEYAIKKKELLRIA